MLGAAAVIHCFFLVLVLLRLSNKLTNHLLAGILCLLAIRMAACLAGLIYPNIESVGIYFGAISFAGVGPLVHFYTWSLWHPTFSWQKNHSLHFVPAILMLLSMPFLHVFIAFAVYMVALMVMTIYLIVVAIRLKKHKSHYRVDQNRWHWTSHFVIGMFTLLFLFHAQSFFFDSRVYQGIIIGATLVLYALTITSLKRIKLFMTAPKKRDKKQQLLALGEQIEKLLRRDQVFTNASLTVASIAGELKVPSYLVSQAINTYFEKSFPEMLNALRIQKAEQLLMDASKSHFTVEAIAYESGFSTLSAFYTTFKKANKKTPTEFRKANHLEVQQIV